MCLLCVTWRGSSSAFEDELSIEDRKTRCKNRNDTHFFCRWSGFSGVLATVDLMSSLLSDLRWFFFLFPSLSHCGKIAKWAGNAAVMDNHRCMFRPEVFSIYCTVKPQFHNTKDDSLILTRGIILLKNKNHKQNHMDLKSKPWTRHYTVIFNTLYTWWCLNPSFPFDLQRSGDKASPSLQYIKKKSLWSSVTTIIVAKHLKGTCLLH